MDHVRFVIGPRNVRSRRAIEWVGGVLRGTEVVGGQENVVYVIAKDSRGTSIAPAEGVA